VISVLRRFGVAKVRLNEVRLVRSSPRRAA
jgi:hypothetical protein